MKKISWVVGASLGILLFGVALIPTVFAQTAQSSCLSPSVSDALLSSLQQLTETANTLFLSNVPSYVLTADQNLLTAITEVITQIEGACLSSTAPSPSPSPTPASMQPTIPSNIITGVQGYDPTTLAYTDGTAIADTYLIIYGDFASAGNTVAIDGTPAVTTYQSTGQINVSLSGIPAAAQNTVTVTTPSGWSGNTDFTIIAAPTIESAPPTTVSVPMLSATQGYNPTTDAYETTANLLTSGDTALILYGSFAAFGNTVLINGEALSPADVTYQGTSQINIDIGSLDTPFTVGVENVGGTSQEITVVANSGAGGQNIVSTTSASGGSGTTSEAGEPAGAIINYCSVDPAASYCGLWLYCLDYPNDPSCISASMSCASNPTSSNCPTSIPASTPTTASPGLTTATTLAQVCNSNPTATGCSGPSGSTTGGSAPATLTVTIVNAPQSNAGFYIRAYTPSDDIDFENSYETSPQTVNIPTGDSFFVSPDDTNPRDYTYSGSCTSDVTAIAGASYACTVTFGATDTCSSAQAAEADCDNNNTCVLTQNGPECACNAGYTMTDGECVAACTGDSCVNSTITFGSCSDDQAAEADCGDNSSCTLDDSGDPTCACDTGYTMTDGECEAMPTPTQTTNSNSSISQPLCNFTEDEVDPDCLEYCFEQGGYLTDPSCSEW